MGSCYSTKSNQMPHTTSSNQQSPAFKRSSTQAQATKTKNSTSARAATTDRGGSSFGFRKPYGGRYAPSNQNGNLEKADKDAGGKGDFVKASVNNKGISTQATNGQPSPARSRFGFKKPSAGVSARVGDSSRNKSSESLHSTASNASKDSQKRTAVARSASLKTSYVTKTASFKPISAQAIRMIDDSESSLPNSRPHSIVDTSGDAGRSADNRINTDGDAGRLKKQNSREDRLNANIPERTDTRSDTNANTRADTHLTKNPADNLTQQNLNIRSHSDERKTNISNKNTVSKDVVSSGFKAPSKLVRPFTKSKSEYSDKIEKTLHEKGTKPQSRGKENVFSTFQKTSPSAGSSSGNRSGLQKRAFSKQQSLPEHSSHANRDDNNAGDKKSSVDGVSVSDNGDKTIDVNREPVVSAKDTECDSLRGKTESINEQEITPGIGFEVCEENFVRDLTEPGENTLQRISKVHSSVPPSVKERLERKPIPAGKAPIARGDNLETSSLGSIASDDLMLETEVDLGDYDDVTMCDTPHGSYGSGTPHGSYGSATPHGSYKAGGVMRNRSRSGSGRFGSRSRSIENNKGQVYSDKAIHKVQMSGQVRSGFKTEKVTFEPKVQYLPGMKGDENVFEPSVQGHAEVKRQGSDASTKREHWRTKRGSTQEEEEESEALGELHQLMDMHNGPVTRRYPRLDKANRPASFPGFHRQVPDPSTDGGHLASGAILRPRRTSSISDDEKIMIDATTYRQMTQEFTVFKTMLLKLKRVIQDDELSSPLTAGPWKNGLAFNTSQPNSPLKNDNKFGLLDYNQDTNSQNYIDTVTKENEDLRHQMLMMKHQIEEQERTIKLLQQQMPSGINIGKKNSPPRQLSKTNRVPTKTASSVEKTTPQSRKVTPLNEAKTASPLSRSTPQAKAAFSSNRSHSLGRYRPEISIPNITSNIANDSQEQSHVTDHSNQSEEGNICLKTEKHVDEQMDNVNDVVACRDSVSCQSNQNNEETIDGSISDEHSSHSSQAVGAEENPPVSYNADSEIETLADRLHGVNLDVSVDSPVVAMATGSVDHGSDTVDSKLVPETGSRNEYSCRHIGENSKSDNLSHSEENSKSDKSSRSELSSDSGQVSSVYQTSQDVTGRDVVTNQTVSVETTVAKGEPLVTNLKQGSGKFQSKNTGTSGIPGTGLSIKTSTSNVGSCIEKSKNEKSVSGTGGKSKLPAFSRIASLSKTSKLPSFKSSKK